MDEEARALALLLAISARNGMEDLHAEGAITDAQMPAMNRALRERFYDVLRAVEALMQADDASGEPLVEWLLDSGSIPSDTDFEEVYADVAYLAVMHEGLRRDLPAVHEIADAAAAGVQETVERIQAGDTRGIAILWRMIPDYWEDPVGDPALDRILAAM